MNNKQAKDMLAKVLAVNPSADAYVAPLRNSRLWSVRVFTDRQGAWSLETAQSFYDWSKGEVR